MKPCRKWTCNGIEWEFFHPRAHPDMLGHIPSWLSIYSPLPAAQQLGAGYISGWLPFEGFTLLEDGKLKYPGDPAIIYYAAAKVGNEEVRVYEHDWVLVLAEDGTFQVCRMD